MVRLARSPTIPPMITAVHLLIYSDDPAATRAFLRDVLGWPFVEEPDVPGWLIFRSGPSELGVHPTSYTHEGTEYSHPRHHSISLMCDDIEATVAELEAKGAEFAGPIEELRLRARREPEGAGADEILVYEPQHPERTRPLVALHRCTSEVATRHAPPGVRRRERRRSPRRSGSRSAPR